MNTDPSPEGVSARAEWAAMWPLPVVGMLGLSGVSMFAFSSGVLMEPITTAFGWSRTLYSSALALQMVLGLFLLPAVGRLIDRFGPRRIALWGMGPYIAGFSLLGLANGAIGQWWALCLVLAVAQGLVTQTVWVAPVVQRFHASRGLAMAVVLAGLGLGSFIWPALTAFYLDALGWRRAFPALAVSWGVIVVPLVVLFFRGPRDVGDAPPRAARPRAYGAALRSRTFVGLVIAGGLFSCAYYGMVVHLVPILRGGGIGLATAAGIAGLAGLFSITGRLATGWLLDRMAVRAIGAVVFLLPALVALLLLGGAGSVPVAIVAVALLGVAAGAEMDIVTFVAARRFGQEVFASVYSIFVALLALSASMGPLLGGALFDLNGSYTPFLLAIVPIAIVCTALILWIPTAPPGDGAPGR